MDFDDLTMNYYNNRYTRDLTSLKSLKDLNDNFNFRLNDDNLLNNFNATLEQNINNVADDTDPTEEQVKNAFINAYSTVTSINSEDSNFRNGEKLTISNGDIYYNIYGMNPIIFGQLQHLQFNTGSPITNIKIYRTKNALDNNNISDNTHILVGETDVEYTSNDPQYNFYIRLHGLNLTHDFKKVNPSNSTSYISGKFLYKLIMIASNRAGQLQPVEALVNSITKLPRFNIRDYSIDTSTTPNILTVNNDTPYITFEDLDNDLFTSLRYSGEQYNNWRITILNSEGTKISNDILTAIPEAQVYNYK